MAEAAIIREELRSDAVSTYHSADIAGAALLPITGEPHGKASTPQAISATSADTARDLREVKRDQGMTQRAWNILEAGGADSYRRALAALRDDTRAAWLEYLADLPDQPRKDERTAEALRDWIDRNWKEWYEQPIAELQHRDAIKDQALGMAYKTRQLELPARPGDPHVPSGALLSGIDLPHSPRH